MARLNSAGCCQPGCRLWRILSSAEQAENGNISGADTDIGGVITDGALMAMGVLEAFVDGDLPLPYVTCDDWNGFQNVAMELEFDKYITVPGGSEASGIAADVLFEYLAGNEVDKVYIIPMQVFTGEEVQAMIPQGMPDSYWALNRIPKEY